MKKLTVKKGAECMACLACVQALFRGILQGVSSG